jgi:hypothetical protein
MKLHLLLCYLVLIFTSLGSASAETPASQTELETLRKENQQLRRQLAVALKKTATPVEAATPAVQETLTTTPPPIESPAPKPSSVQSFLDTLFLRKSVFAEDLLAPGAISDPAQFNYVHSGHGKDSYSIDSGLAATFTTAKSGNWQRDWGVGADYHRNTTAASATNLFQTGLIADTVFGNATVSDTVRMKASVSFKDDNVKDVRSVAAGWDILPVIAFLKIDNYHVLGPAHWRWQPFAGFRYESAVDEGKGIQSGHRLAARYGAEVQLFPLFDYYKRSVEITAKYTMWSDLGSTGPYQGKDWNGYLDVEANYWFHGGATAHTGKMDVGIGLSYQNGDSPELNIANADLLTIALKAKF